MRKTDRGGLIRFEGARPKEGLFTPIPQPGPTTLLNVFVKIKKIGQIVQHICPNQTNVFVLFSSLDLCLCRGDFELCMLLEMDHHGKDIVSTSKFYFGDRHVRKCKNVINIVTGLVQVFGRSWW